MSVNDKIFNLVEDETFDINSANLKKKKSSKELEDEAACQWAQANLFLKLPGYKIVKNGSWYKYEKILY